MLLAARLCFQQRASNTPRGCSDCAGLYVGTAKHSLRCMRCATRAGRARRGPTLRECFLLHAVARLALHPHITNIQASWVKMGPQRAAQLLAGGRAVGARNVSLWRALCAAARLLPANLVPVSVCASVWPALPCWLSHGGQRPVPGIVAEVLCVAKRF